MSSIIFSNGDTSKEVSLSEVNSVEDVASHMKEVMTNEQKTTLEELSNSEARLDREENWRAGYDVSTEGALGDYPED
tara:strand:- start:901 stop:1131 length:231 start_codon:yes stop_codon:yes gene_type:complete